MHLWSRKTVKYFLMIGLCGIVQKSYTILQVTQDLYIVWTNWHNSTLAQFFPWAVPYLKAYQYLHQILVGTVFYTIMHSSTLERKKGRYFRAANTTNQRIAQSSFISLISMTTARLSKYKSHCTAEKQVFYEDTETQKVSQFSFHSFHFHLQFSSCSYT